METGALGTAYAPGQVILRQGTASDCMYVILEGTVEIYLERDDGEVSVKLCREGDFVGEVALFNREAHSASARTLQGARLLTIDRKSFMRRIQEDPTVAFRLVQSLCQRVKELTGEIGVLNRVVQECLHEQLRQHETRDA